MHFGGRYFSGRRYHHWYPVAELLHCMIQGRRQFLDAKLHGAPHIDAKNA